MMKLKNLVINTERIAREFVSRWGHVDAEVIFFRASANYVYLIKYDNKRYYLRFSLEEERNINDIKAEIDFLLYLYNNKYSVSSPVKSLDGNYIEKVNIDKTYYGVLFEEVKGVNLDIENMDLTDFYNWGNSLAKLHNLSSQYKHTDTKRNDISTIIKNMKEILMSIDDNTILHLEKISSWVTTLSKESNIYGLIHGDFELDNIFWNVDINDFITIDYDDSFYGYYMLDIAFALRDLDDLDKEKADISFSSFIEGYRSIKDISDSELYNYNNYKKFVNLFIYVKIKYALKDEVIEKPVWFDNLHNKLINMSINIKKEFN